MIGCVTEKLVIPYKWLDDYYKLTLVGLVEYKAFYCKLKGGSIIMHEEYDKFV